MKIEVRILPPAAELVIAHASPFRGKNVLAFIPNPVITGHSCSSANGQDDFA